MAEKETSEELETKSSAQKGLKKEAKESVEEMKGQEEEMTKTEGKALKEDASKSKAVESQSETPKDAKASQSASPKPEPRSASKGSTNQKMDNPYRKIFVEKITLSMGTGTDMELLKKGMKLLKLISGSQPVKTLARKRIPAWSIRPGLPIGCKVTLRGKKAEEKLKEVLKAVDDKLSVQNFDEQGNFSFGIKEYIDLPSMDYNYDLGILGFQVSVTLARPGYRVKERKYYRRNVGKSHKLSKEEAMEFMKKRFNITIE